MLDDETICNDDFCDLIKKVQFTVEPKFIKEGPEDYDKRFKKYIYQFLYEDQTLEKILKKIWDITNVYYISLDTENSYIGLICLIFISIISFLMLLSLLVLFNDNFSPYISFLSSDFWIITVLGFIIILWIPIFNYGPVEAIKGQLKPLLLSVGYTLNICPTLYKLIFHFPEDNKVKRWIIKHKYILLVNIKLMLY